jgi:hypothetical protein
MKGIVRPCYSCPALSSFHEEETPEQEFGQEQR